ncbi:hypothetical protein [Myceligenerans crystallogenes]|uniref:Uncharacterized protein n=1 Tax=Myceligenerans crystallogenes TaxID=316335 RepID=A0ABP4ZW67_9MICO
MPTEHAFDVAVATVILAVFAGLWFLWSMRHIRGLWALLPIAGAVSSVVVAASGTIDAVGAVADGTSVEGPTIGIYLVALLLQGAVTRWLTGFLASHNQTRLVPSTVAVSLVIHVVVLAELLTVSYLYFVALFCLAAVILAWPVAAVGRLMTPNGTPMTHPTTGVLMGAILLAGAAQSLV